MIEKRNHRRAILNYNLEVFDLEDGDCLGHMVDISPGGFKIVSKCKITPGKDYLLRIEIPENPSPKTLIVKAKSCWSMIDINPEYIASGFCFTGLSEESLEIIKWLVKSYEFGGDMGNSSY